MSDETVKFLMGGAIGALLGVILCWALVTIGNMWAGRHK